MAGQIYIGIDPGISGAVTILENSKYKNSFVIPTINTIKNKKNKKEVDISTLYTNLKKYKNSIIEIEKVHSMTGQGISSAFSFGYTTGEISAISQIISDKFIEVTPQKWQKDLKNKFFTTEIVNYFSLYNIDGIVSYISDKQFKEFFIKTSGLKSTKQPKLESLFLYYLIDDGLKINYKNNNIVDSYLIAYHCFLNQNQNKN